VLYEKRHQPLATRRKYIERVLRNAMFAGLLLGSGLLIGVLGYHGFAGLSWLDALVNASMILAGMGPVDPVKSIAGKLFESAYAIFSGVVFLTSVGVLLAPAAHRFLHHFHLEGREGR
jgi:hypothetical protein